MLIASSLADPDRRAEVTACEIVVKGY